MNIFSAVLVSGSKGGDFVQALLFLIIVGLVLGIILWIISAIPMIPPMFKEVLKWVVYLVGALLLINFLLSIAGHPLIVI